MDSTEPTSIPGLDVDRDPSIAVLHVDDDADVRDRTWESLQESPGRFTVRSAETPRDALEILDDGTPVDCVISDHGGQGMDGLAFLEAVRERDAQLPFVLFTDEGSEELASEAIAAGVTDYLPKGEGADQYDVLATRIENAVDRYRTQREVVATRDWFENVLTHSSDYLFLLDVQGRFEYVSPAVERNLGYEPSAVVGDLAFEYVHPDDREHVRELFGAIVADPGREETTEMRIEEADGSWGWLEVRGRKIVDENLLDGVLINARRITERKERERELARRNDLFERTQRLGEIGGWEIDVAEDEFRWTSGVYRILGVDPDHDPDLQATIDRFHPDDRPALEASLGRAFQGEKPHGADYRLRTEDGEYRWFYVKGGPQTDEDGEVVRIRGVVQDVHEERERERRIRTLHETTRRLILADSAAAIADIATDAARDVIDLEINGVLLHHESRGMLVPESLTAVAERIVDDDLALDVDDSLAGAVFHTGESQVFDDVSAEPGTHNPDTPIRSELILPLGDHGVFMASKTETGGFDDELVVLAEILAANVEAALDRTDKHRRLAEREQQLAVQNERLEEFTSIVSHDLRNPLNVATGRLELAREEYDSEHLVAVDRSLDRMDDLIDELRTLAVAGNVVTTQSPVALADVARAAWTYVDTADSTLAVETDRVVEADEGRLQQLLENLFRNAVEHGSTSPRQGEDAVEHSTTSPEQAPDAVEHGDSAVTVTVGEHEDGFFVADDGRGIDPDDRELIFEHGYSTRSDGTGLGLRIVEQIAEAHGWSVAVEQSADGGARFEFSGM